MKRTTFIISVLSLVLLVGACRDDDGASGSGAVEAVIDPGDRGVYRPAIDPVAFVDVIDNPYLPLTSSARWVYDGDEQIEVVVTGDRREVMGVSTWVVRDTVREDGEIVEDTFDYFAQDRDGNVWYFGEDTREFENGVAVRSDGSWEAGIDGALPGIAMPAHPTVGDAYRQEFKVGTAEDMGEILAVGVERATDSDRYADVVVTRDWTPLEPDVVEEKWYARGVGNVRSTNTAGETGTIELVEFTPGR